jgi:sugar/nucleoside kinase (ribokinase family)
VSQPGTPAHDPVPEFDVVGIGSPLVDVLSTVSDTQLDELGLVKGSMALVDLSRADAIYRAMGPTTEMSGGSAANTMAGIAALGGLAGFVGMIADDEFGGVFTHDIRAAGVTFEPIVAAAVHTDAETTGTGRCLVLVTEDAERTMATHLGVAGRIDEHNLPERFVSQAGLLYLEGYLWDLPPAKAALRRAIEVAHEADAAVALSLSDPFCVDRHTREFLDLVRDDVDVLFANEDEIIRLFGASSFDGAVGAVAETGILAALTCGARGCVVVGPGDAAEVPAAPVVEVVDTTGAGDLFAAGFLFGLSVGHDPERCALLGSLCAAEVISHLGARPVHDLRNLAAASGLL